MLKAIIHCAHSRKRVQQKVTVLIIRVNYLQSLDKEVLEHIRWYENKRMFVFLQNKQAFSQT